MTNSGGFNWIRSHDLCDAGATLNQLTYETIQCEMGVRLVSRKSTELKISVRPEKQFVRL